MDPLHPETAVPRVKELSKQLDRVLSDFRKATTTGKLAELEREGILVVQEMSLVAPRLHEVVMQTSRSQRTAIARGLVEKPVEKSELEYRPEQHGGGTVTLEYKPVEKPVEKASLTPEEEGHFAKLRNILEDAKAKFDGKDARNKETGEVYSNLYFMTVSPIDADAHKYGIIVSASNSKEELSFGNEKVVDFLNGFEPVEKLQEKCVNETPKQPEKCVETEVAISKKETTTKKKTTKKVKK